MPLATLAHWLWIGWIAAATAAFPEGRCYDRACGSSPYNLTYVGKQKDKVLNITEHCFDVHVKPCTVESKYACCSTLRQNLPKVVLRIRPECTRTTLRGVTVGGKPKKGGVFVDAYKSHSELRLTSLQGINALNGTATAPANSTANRICVTVGRPCNGALRRLCQQLPCQVAVWEPARHECCPTCIVAGT